MKDIKNSKSVIKEYYTMSIESTGQETEDKLNNLAEQGWKLICSYSRNGNWLILERDKIKPLKNSIIEKAKQIVRDYDDEDEIIRELNKLR